MSKRGDRYLTLDEEMILEFYRCGYSAKEISNTMNIELSVVNRAIKKDLDANTEEIQD